MAPDEHTMTAAAIARLAGVGRAAVSNWRHRHPDFPAPVGGSLASPTFSRAEVQAWLVSTGKAGQLATAGRTDTGTQRVADPLARPGSGSDEQAWRAEQERPGASIADLTSGQLLARVM
ncbi:MAG: N-6 DNA methylase, partial [Streptosporangiaceae bacterium]